MPHKNFPVFHVVSNHFVDIVMVLRFPMDLFILEVLAVIGAHITSPSCVARSSCRSESKEKTNVMLLFLSLRQTYIDIRIKSYKSYVYTKPLTEISRKYNTKKNITRALENFKAPRSFQNCEGTVLQGWKKAEIEGMPVSHAVSLEFEIYNIWYSLHILFDPGGPNILSTYQCYFSAHIKILRIPGPDGDKYV